MSDPTTTSNNVLVRCWQALWIDGDTDAALGCLHDPYVRHGVDGPATMSPEAYVAHVTTITGHLRGTSLDVDHLHEVGNMLYARFTMRGVNITTGGTIAIAWIGHYRLVDGKLAESWTM
ncbi:MAG: nuclear transport factor 2 family protein, partial [Acidimicrobiaceae bacterium]